MSDKQNTAGLGEYTDADLLQELVERGVINVIIGEADPVVAGRHDHNSIEAMENDHRQARNILRAEQHKRLEEISHE